MDDEYAAFAGGKLKLKKSKEGVESAGKKKKRRDKERKKLEQRGPKMEEASKAEDAEHDIIGEQEAAEGSESEGYQRRYTKAELAYKKQQEKMQNERINQKAMMTHKQRVEEFNRHLDSLTEHFDIPKVSWTK